MSEARNSTANGTDNGSAHFPAGLNIVPTNHLDEISSTPYDYIIVGGGAGGCPLAAALAEDKSLRILLLERGASREKYPETQTIAGWLDLPDTDAVQVIQDKSGVWFVRGNVLGGGTAVNFGIWGHATPENITEEGWDPEEIKKAYEHLDARLSHPGVVGPVQKKFQEAWEEVGLGPNNGVTPEHPVGVKTLMRTWDSDSLRHPADELLVGLDNVDIVTQALVTKVRIIPDSDGTLKAVGVDFTGPDGTPQRADVNPGSGEIILSAGTVGTPQLLILSGIGPTGELQKLGIDPLVDLPVGLKLADNPLSAVAVQLRDSVEEDGSCSTVAITKKHIYFVSAGGKVGTHVAKYGLLPLVPPGSRTPEAVATQDKVNRALSEEMQKQMNQTAVLSFKLYRVKSRGAVTVESTDPSAQPAVDFAYFTHPDDVSDGIAGVRTLKAALASQTLKSLKCDTVPEVLCQLAPELAAAFPPGTYPGALPLLPELENKEEVATWLKNTVCTCWHMHGSCRVGEVVDKWHRVKGVDGLRVMDASVFRDSPGSNPMATIMAVSRSLGLRLRKERAQ